MKLAGLLKGIGWKADAAGAAEALLQEEITDVTADSRRVPKGSVFVCVRGGKADGHDFANAAAAAGCAVLVAEHPTGAPVPHILVPDTRAAYALLCANFFGNPADGMKLIGITGTNGKTTTALLLRHILEESGRKTGLIGTIQNMAGDEILPAKYTTPEPYELQSLFRRMADAKCEYVVMEVSSQALAQERVAGLRYAASVFTNLTQDHLDYHGTMENYLAAKQKLFDQSAVGIVNLDDPYADRIIRNPACRRITYSTKNMDADYTARNIKYRPDGLDYEVVGLGVIGRAMLGVPGTFNVYNSLAALSCALTLGLPMDAVLTALKTAKGAKGRAEVVPTGRDFTVIIDYAHTPDGIEKICKAIDGVKTGRLITVFGCGGDRDRTKRPKMGKIAAENSDFLVITSDNPRTEDPAAIIRDILPGLEGTNTPHVTVGNRRDAIEYAMRHAQAGDIVLLAGKGHEDYQILKTGKIHFDEREVVASISRKMDAEEGRGE